MKTNRLPTRAARTFFLATLLGVPGLLPAADSVADALQRCATEDDAAMRLACYDKISGRENVAPVVIAASIEPPIDDLGAEMLPQKSTAKAEKLSAVVKLSKCTKDVRKKYVFHFENGQVWKQVSDKRLFFKECDFNVIISKDFFGYKMQQEGKKTRFRVSRIR